MEFVSLRLENIRKFSRYTFQFHTGVTGILASNGGGKSTLAECLYFALTGKLHELSKEHMVTWGKESGLVELTFRSGGIEYILTRHLPKSKTALVWVENGDIPKKLTASAEIACKMKDLCGIDPETAGELSFVRQGEFRNIFLTTPSARLALLQKLTGSQKAEQIWSTLGNATSGIECFADRSEEKEGVLRDIQRFETRIEESRQLKQSLQEQLNQYLEFEQQAREIRSGVSEKQRDAEAARILEKIQAVHRAVPEDSRYAPGQESGLQDAVLKMRAAIQRETQQLQPLQQEQRSLVNTRQETQRLLNSVQTELSRDELSEANLRMTMDGLKSGTCPTCKQPFVPQEDILLAEEQKLVLLQTKITRGHTRVAEVQELLRIQNQREHELQTAMTGLLPAIAEYRALLQNLETLQGHLRDLEEKLQNPVVTEEQTAWAENILQGIQQLRARVDAVSTTDMEHSLQHSRTILQAIEAQEERNRRAVSLKEFIDSTRKLFHREALPAVVVHEFRKRLRDPMQRILEKFGFPYEAWLNENLEFVYRDEDTGQEHPVLCCSGGQQIILALAFCVARAKISPGLPLLVLDEPTTHLDDHNKDALREVLASVRSVLEKEAVVLVIDHYKPLESSMSRTVHLEE